MKENRKAHDASKAKEPKNKMNEEPEVIETEEIVAEPEEPVADPLELANQEIEALQKQLAASKTDVLRAYADTDNTRKRLSKEMETAKKYRFQSAAMELLPILDNLDRALSSVPESEEVKNFVTGFDMIRTQLVNVLENEGVKEINALNQPFDANYMQALMTEKKEGVEPNTVTEVLQKGYTLKDRLLRPALVKVSE